MIGSIIGDIVGSIYEFQNIKTKDFELFTPEKIYTDDSILTVATADWLLGGGDVATYYRKWGWAYPDPMGSYGGGFVQWLDRANRGDLSPYNSCGNGSAMRVSPVGWAFDTEVQTLNGAKRSAECTHNHPEGIKGAQATALSIFMARKGFAPTDIQQRVEADFGYDLSLTVDEIRPRYSWDGLDADDNGGTCQGSVPQALCCALQATDYEDAVRNAVSIGGDSDTIACITGGVAEALFGVPQAICDKGMALLPRDLREVVESFERKYGCRIC